MLTHRAKKGKEEKGKEKDERGKEKEERRKEKRDALVGRAALITKCMLESVTTHCSQQVLDHELFPLGHFRLS